MQRSCSGFSTDVYKRQHRLHGEELAARHLFERRRMKHVIRPPRGVAQALQVADIAYVEFDPGSVLRVLRLQFMAHIVLLFLVAGEDADRCV